MPKAFLVVYVAISHCVKCLKFLLICLQAGYYDSDFATGRKAVVHYLDDFRHSVDSAINIPRSQIEESSGWIATKSIPVVRVCYWANLNPHFYDNQIALIITIN